MTDLLHRLPPVAAYAARPLSVDEIDAHPDGARIWATIMALGVEFDRQVDEAAEEIRRTGGDD